MKHLFAALPPQPSSFIKLISKHYRAIAFLACGLVIPVSAQTVEKGTIEIKNEQIHLNGQPFVYRAGEIHPSRVPKEYWRHRLRMLKAKERGRPARLVSQMRRSRLDLSPRLITPNHDTS